MEKQNPDRTPSGKGRLIWDGRVPNAKCAKEDHPPALQPRHRSLAKEILWWQQRLPGMPVLMAKLDVAEAFRWLHHRLEDVSIFATELEGRE